LLLPERIAAGSVIKDLRPAVDLAGFRGRNNDEARHRASLLDAYSG
jgi:hypothetical protein